MIKWLNRILFDWKLFSTNGQHLKRIKWFLVKIKYFIYRPRRKIQSKPIEVPAINDTISLKQTDPLIHKPLNIGLSDYFVCLLNYVRVLKNIVNILIVDY